MTPTLWIVSEFYYPDENATGYLMTMLAEGLAKADAVGVICGRDHGRAGDALAREMRNGVSIRRCPSTRLDKNNLLFRSVNVLTVCLSAAVVLLRSLKPGDRVVVVTNPPFLPFVASIVARRKGATCTIIVHDVYPEALIGTGVLRDRSLIVSLLHAMHRRLYRRVQSIVVLGRDMRDLILPKVAPGGTRVELIPNAADTDAIRPMDRRDHPLRDRLGLQETFVVSYVGNMGRSHDIRLLVQGAVRTADDPGLRYLFIGDGIQRRWLETTVAEHHLQNTIVMRYPSRMDQSAIHTACDVSVISLHPEMTGASVPSRLYNMMAAGRPIIAIASATSELARVVQEESIGWLVAPGDLDGLMAAIAEARRSPERLMEMSARARAVALEKYSMRTFVESYRRLLDADRASGRPVAGVQTLECD